MNADISSLIAGLGPPGMAAGIAPGAASPGGGGHVQLGWGASLADVGAFERALDGVQTRVQAHRAGPPSKAAQALFKPFDHINGEAAKLSLDARAAANSGREITPGELVSLTVRCQEFMFHCQLTSNIANRTSEGLQQLFRQQS